jgi:transcriptional regulator with XRE-family HTH domain
LRAVSERPNYQEVLAANIRRLAESRGVSLNKLADFAGVGRRHLFAVLAGEHDPALGWCDRIAAALEVDLLELLTDRRDGEA